ncbi:MAG TPA: hypothetical protein VGX68_20785 [Thermoanaerobaculia bacterium]|nr:hypothetical protein [Thermoanaerobaculia bacterium]
MSITLQNVSASGVLSDSATVGTVTTVLESAGLDETPSTEEISAITSAFQNNVVLQIGWTLMLREILDRRASALPSTGPVLAKVRATMTDPFIAKVVLTRGGNTYTVYGCYAGFSEGPYAKGKNTSELRLLAVDNGAAPAYS